MVEGQFRNVQHVFWVSVVPVKYAVICLASEVMSSLFSQDAMAASEFCCLLARQSLNVRHLHIRIFVLEDGITHPDRKRETL